jgi:hypothetical protein
MDVGGEAGLDSWLLSDRVENRRKRDLLLLLDSIGGVGGLAASGGVFKATGAWLFSSL